MASPIGLEASRLETKLQAAIRNHESDPRDVAIIGAAALEVCELDYYLACNAPHLILWLTMEDPNG